MALIRGGCGLFMRHLIWTIFALGPFPGVCGSARTPPIVPPPVWRSSRISTSRDWERAVAPDRDFFVSVSYFKNNINCGHNGKQTPGSDASS